MNLKRLDWIVQCFTSLPTQYRLYGRRFLQVKRPNQQYQSTEGASCQGKQPKKHKENANYTYTYTHKIAYKYSKMCTEFRSWVWRISKSVRTHWASVDQQLINKAIDPWRQRMKTIVKVHGGHIEQLFT